MHITSQTGDARESGGALARYVAAATLARGADAGAAVGLVLLATAPGAGLAHPAATGGLLAAALTAPHLLGPLVARRLDAAGDGRRTLAGACAAYATAVGIAAVALGRVPMAAVAAAVLVAGTCGPLLTGGLSSRLAGIAGASERARRRAEGWDAVSYGLAGTAGPATVALLAAAGGPRAALLALAGAALAAAGFVLGLPRAGAGRERPAPLAVRDALGLLAARGPLRRVGMATVLTAAGTGALPVLAVVLAAALGRAGAGATLIAAFGLGNLAGSLAVTAFPLQGEPDRATSRHVAVLGAALGLCAASPSYPAAILAFALAGAANAPFFTATLAARSRYAPAAARAQVFVTMAGLKVAAASAGTALAGAAAGLGPRALLGAGAAVTVLGALGTSLDRALGARGAATPG
jgi:hypothetical protein